MPDPELTVAALRPPPGSDEDPIHRRTITTDVYEREDHVVVIAKLQDERPWAGDGSIPRLVHSMELAVVVRLEDMVIVDAVADMEAYPHAECTRIEPTFHDLVGLAIGRGYMSVVAERFGRQRGCSHLEFLARALGPVVIQGVASAGARRFERGEGVHPFRDENSFRFLANSCHIWAEDGPGLQKVAVGWLPLLSEYPAPSVVEIRRRFAPGGAPEAEGAEQADEAVEEGADS